MVHEPNDTSCISAYGARGTLRGTSRTAHGSRLAAPNTEGELDGLNLYRQLPVLPLWPYGLSLNESARCTYTDVLTEPPESFAVALTHDNRAHKDLDRSDVAQRHLALRALAMATGHPATCLSCPSRSASVQRARQTYLARCLVQTQLVPELFLRYGVVMVDLVTEDNEGDLRQALNGDCYVSSATTPNPMLPIAASGCTFRCKVRLEMMKNRPIPCRGHLENS